MPLNFEQYAQKGNQMVNHLADELDIPRDQAARILKAVLHALRNRLSLEENLDFLSQLPMILKGVYVDGWKPNKPIKRSHKLSDFIQEVRTIDGINEYYDFGEDEEATWVLQGVFRLLHQYISEGEMNDIISGLPKEMKYFIAETKSQTEIF